MRFAVYHSTKGRNWQQKASHSVSHDSPSFAHAIVFRQIQVTDDLDILNTKKTVDCIFLSCVSGSTQLWGNERRRCPMFLFQLNNRSTNGCGSKRCLYQDEKRVVNVDNGGSSNTRPTNGYVILAACVDDSIEVNSAFKCSARSLNLLLRSSSFEYLNKFWSTKYFPVSSPQHEVCFFTNKIFLSPRIPKIEVGTWENSLKRKKTKYSVKMTNRSGTALQHFILQWSPVELIKIFKTRAFDGYFEFPTVPLLHLHPSHCKRNSNGVTS